MAPNESNDWDGVSDWKNIPLSPPPFWSIKAAVPAKELVSNPLGNATGLPLGRSAPNDAPESLKCLADGKFTPPWTLLPNDICPKDLKSPLSN